MADLPAGTKVHVAQWQNNTFVKHELSVQIRP